MEVVLVKLGGSLITDKRRSEEARVEVIERLAAEIREASEHLECRLLLGHGSGSFGHVAAARTGIHAGIGRPSQLLGVTETQDRAASLNRIVIGALRERGVPVFSLAPSSFLLSAGGVPSELWTEALVAAIDVGLTPVVYGDVVIDRELGASIASTEAVLLALARDLGQRGLNVRRSVWLGETDGIYDARGVTIGEIDLEAMDEVLNQIGVAAGTDVTGGMRHRLETAARLAELGIESWIADGTEPGMLQRILQGGTGVGTRVRAESGGSPPAD